MIPWFDFSSTLFGGAGLFPLWIPVAVGIAVGASAAQAHARALGLSRASVHSLLTTVLVVGLVCAHLFYVLACHERAGSPGWLALVNPLAGLSSIGGFAGAVVALLWWTFRHGQPRAPYADSLAAGFAPGWLFCRLGSFAAHAHPGRATHFFLGVRYPGGARHDLGLDEALFAAGLTALFWLLQRRPRPLGTYVTILAVTYAPMRFGLDFLRTADPRYYGLTPAQLGCYLLWAAAMYLATALLTAPPRGEFVDDAPAPDDRPVEVRRERPASIAHRSPAP